MEGALEEVGDDDPEGTSTGVAGVCKLSSSGGRTTGSRVMPLWIKLAMVITWEKVVGRQDSPTNCQKSKKIAK